MGKCTFVSPIEDSSVLYCQREYSSSSVFQIFKKKKCYDSKTNIESITDYDN